MSLFSKFKNNLQKTSNFLSSNILTSFQNKKVDNETLEELETILISADISLDVVEKLLNSVRKVKSSDQDVAEKVLETLAKEIEIVLHPRERPILEQNEKKSKILIFIGVNGSGKTTTIGKISNQISKEKKVLIAACDTFRAAAIDQLEKWAEKVDAVVIKSDSGSDPASVAYKSLEYAKNNNINQVLIDTAGRLQNKKNLMDEFKKIANVIKKNDETAPHDVILVLDATSGQNIINQLEEFNKIITVTGLIMTKLDGTAKGGVLISISKKYKIPIIALGLGEKEDDLQIFDSEEFANAFTQIN